MKIKFFKGPAVRFDFKSGRSLYLSWWSIKGMIRGWYYKTFHPHSKGRFFVPERELKECEKFHASPSGKYCLTIKAYSTDKDPKSRGWGYSQGLVGHLEASPVGAFQKDLIADVRLNYGHFPFQWIENHPDGHDYLICTEDYQGLTVIQLDTGKRKDYLPLEAYYGSGFCHVDFQPSPDKTLLAVSGCYWAAPYECRFYDFLQPLKLPYREVFQDNDWHSEFYGWLNNSECEVGNTVDQRKDGKTMKDFLDENGKLKRDEYYVYEGPDGEELWEEAQVKKVLKVR